MHAKRVERGPSQLSYRLRRFRAAEPPLVSGVGSIYYKLRPDVRRFSDGGDRLARCRKCGARIVLLPDDRRQGFCFDCFDTLEVVAAAV